MKQKQTHRPREQICGCWVVGEGLDWELGISTCKLYVERINNKVLLYGTGNHIQYSVVNHNEKEKIKKSKIKYFKMITSKYSWPSLSMNTEPGAIKGTLYFTSGAQAPVDFDI